VLVLYQGCACAPECRREGWEGGGRLWAQSRGVLCGRGGGVGQTRRHATWGTGREGAGGVLCAREGGWGGGVGWGRVYQGCTKGCTCVGVQNAELMDKNHPETPSLKQVRQ